MSFKNRIILYALFPLFLITVTMFVVTRYQVDSLSDKEIQRFRDNLLKVKKQEIINYTNLVKGTMNHIINNPEFDEATAFKAIYPLLGESQYDDNDGYFFIYNAQGVNLFHPVQKELEGQNLFHLKDSSGYKVIQKLLSVAHEGGGFVSYKWNRPSTGKEQEKISYAVSLDRWGWMLGTGFYMDEITHKIIQVENQVKYNIRWAFYIVLVLTIVSTVLLGFWINWRESRLANIRLRESAHKFIRLQVSERRRFAQELHDGINQLMVAAKHRVELVQWQATKGKFDSLEQLDQAKKALDDAIQEVRCISHGLRPRLLDDMGLKVALEHLFNQYHERTQVELVFDYDLDKKRLSDEVEITLYRVIQEALMNIEKHANAKSIHLKLYLKDDSVMLEIQDDGCGFELEEIHQDINHGIGLKNMQERVTLLSGTFTLNTATKTGTEIKVSLPKEY